jgi:hypothetical protein
MKKLSLISPYISLLLIILVLSGSFGFTLIHHSASIAVQMRLLQPLPVRKWSAVVIATMQKTSINTSQAWHRFHVTDAATAVRVT